MPSFIRTNKIILADSQAALRDSTAKSLAVAEDMRIVADCADLDRMYRAIADFPDSIVLFAASLQPDLTRLQILLETTGNRGIVIVDDRDTAEAYLELGFSGVVFRSDNGSTLVACVHRVAVGDFWIPAQLMRPEPSEENVIGLHVRDRITPNEMRLLSRVAIGLCMRLRVGVGETMRPFGTP
jgi:DNA-binding NarL/FixJ family response regulator